MEIKTEFPPNMPPFQFAHGNCPFCHHEIKFPLKPAIIDWESVYNEMVKLRDAEIKSLKDYLNNLPKATTNNVLTISDTNIFNHNHYTIEQEDKITTISIQLKPENSHQILNQIMPLDKVPVLLNNIPLGDFRLMQVFPEMRTEEIILRRVEK